MQDRYTSCIGITNLLHLSCNGHETIDQCPFVSKFEGVTLACCQEAISAHSSWMVVYTLQSHNVAQLRLHTHVVALNMGVML